MKMKNPKVRNNSNFLSGCDKGELFSLPSITVPNESYTIRELFNKHVRGQNLPAISREGYYPESVSHSSFDYEELSRSDLVDKQEYAEVMRETIEKGLKHEKETEKKKAAKLKEEADELEAIKAEYKKSKEKKPKEGFTKKVDDVLK